jgi:alkanesulfonate monooxygenase SsuD/methylene tetrahydromethanopterin reductase-like flavin-dependent oxidoreductase (luciferase family)
MKFGIHIGHMGGPIGEMRKLWKFADAKGFDWFSVSDHFQESPPRGGEMDCYEAIATLTAAAMDTEHVRLGSGVYCVVYRNPGLLAKSLTTIDHLSNGRVDCGLGAGWHGVEAEAFGYPFPTIGPREDMLEEYAQIMRMLLDSEQRRANFEGKHFKMTNAPNNPKPLQPRIPIWIGGRGEKRTLRAAAKYADGWNGAYIGPDDWKHKSDVLDQWCEKEGRDPKSIMRAVNLGFYLGTDPKSVARAEEKFQSHFGGPAAGDRASRTGYLRGNVKDAREMVEAFQALGCTRLSIAFREGPYDWEALEAFASDIVNTRLNTVDDHGASRSRKS